MKISDLIDQYEQGAKLRGLSPTQLNALKPIRRCLGKFRPRGLTPVMVGSYIADRRKGHFTNAHAKLPAADGTIRRELGALSAVLNWGADKRLIKRDEVPTIDLPPCSPPRENFLAGADADRLFVKARILVEAAHPTLGRAALFACIALDTWARADAVETLTWGRVSVDKGQIDYRDPRRPETKKRRVPVPMSSRLHLLLAMLRLKAQPADAVVGPVTQYAWKKFVTWAGFPDLTRHDLRRTGISCAIARGVDLLKVAQMAGDDLATILKHYARFAPDYLDGVVS